MARIKFMSDLEPNEQIWLAKAVVGIILADGIVDEKEVTFIKKLCKVFLDEEPRETLKQIATYLKDKELPMLEKMEILDAEKLIYMLDILVASIFVNEKKYPNEVRRFFKAGTLLGINYEILMLRLTNEKEKFRNRMSRQKINEEIREEVSKRLERKKGTSKRKT